MISASNRFRNEIEARFLARVDLYRNQYRCARIAAMTAERKQRHADNEVNFQGCWVPIAAEPRISAELLKCRSVTFIELVALLAFSAAAALGIWWLFMFLMMP